MSEAMKIKITKAKIIKAIETEAHLQPQSFAIMNEGVCEVCAVGAVVRGAIKNNNNSEVIGNVACAAVTIADAACMPGQMEYRDAALALIDAGDYWSALSVFFEGTSEEVSTMRARKRRTTEFVRENFPASVTLNIGAHAPARQSNNRVTR